MKSSRFWYGPFAVVSAMLFMVVGGTAAQAISAHASSSTVMSGDADCYFCICEGSYCYCEPVACGSQVATTSKWMRRFRGSE